MRNDHFPHPPRAPILIQSRSSADPSQSRHRAEFSLYINRLNTPFEIFTNYYGPIVKPFANLDTSARQAPCPLYTLLDQSSACREGTLVIAANISKPL